MRRKRPEKWKNGFVLHQDNAPCHTSLVIRQFLADKKITVCPHPPHSPDLAPCDFWLFPKIKLKMKGNRFDTIPEIEATTKERLRALTKDDFQSCFRSWQDRWNKRTGAMGTTLKVTNCTLKLM
jgi:transposase